MDLDLRGDVGDLDRDLERLRVGGGSARVVGL
jgi:hypothetical protein